MHWLSSAHTHTHTHTHTTNLEHASYYFSVSNEQSKLPSQLVWPSMCDLESQALFTREGNAFALRKPLSQDDRPNNNSNS